MILKTRLFGNTYEFASVKEVLAKANEEKSGDRLAGVAAATSEERVAAKTVLAQLTLNDLFNNPVVPYEEDEVTRIIVDQVNTRIFNSIKNWTVEELREWILSDTTTDNDIKFISRGLTSEMIAAVCKLMSNMDLIVGAKKIHIEKRQILLLVDMVHFQLVYSLIIQLIILTVLWHQSWKAYPMVLATLLLV